MRIPPRNRYQDPEKKVIRETLVRTTPSRGVAIRFLAFATTTYDQGRLDAVSSGANLAGVRLSRVACAGSRRCSRGVRTVDGGRREAFASAFQRKLCHPLD